EPQSWAQVAREVYALRGATPTLVAGISTDDYAKQGTAPRPRSSVLDLSKIRAAGFNPPSASERLAEYLGKGT
ncbi:sugar nucleotide-binding protein, partial [Paraburkholderia sp. SIMBA_030]